ncbi:hypothetical protein B0H15DRAFT_948585 [Mycena belliarum]|uniref:MYND-type domain-containing protein n=1 Tax=Mycena belliarum TaxID=1033014 RepID=A0AAD6UAJ8_9AGAR|nr:hypothetical protein B0H15DRAFT_948585 [Mycena belliae]
MAYHAVPIVALPLIQNALRQPETWNSDWEKITQTVDRVQSPSDLVASAAFQLRAYPSTMDEFFLEYPTMLGRLCHVQAWLTVDALQYFVSEDLEAKWMSASPELRGKHVLIGISNACSIAKNLHDTRTYCGRELRLARLQNDGRALLDLLDTVMVEGTSHLRKEGTMSDLTDAVAEGILKVPGKPRYVPHPTWDAFANARERLTATDTEKLALGNILVLRTKLICHIIHFTIRSFLGLELPEITVTKHRKRKMPAEALSIQAFGAAFMEQTLGPAGAKAVAKDNKEAFKERQSKRKEHCSYAGCSIVNDDSVKYPRCKKCWENMRREVLYCSVECQKADWKLNHKTICGRALTFDAVSKPVLAPRPTVKPPAVGAYVPSKVLLLQIAALSKHPKIDYFIMGELNDSVDLDFPDPEAQGLFRKCRDKAMTTGDRLSVAIMAHFLCWMTMDAHCIAKGATSSVIVRQLKKEYGFDELHRAVAEMQERQNRDPFKRPVLLTSMSPQNWMKFCRGMNVTRQVVLE